MNETEIELTDSVDEQKTELDRASDLLDAAGKMIKAVLDSLPPETAPDSGEGHISEAHRLMRLRAQLNMLLEETRDVEGRVAFAARNHKDYVAPTPERP